MEKYQSYLSLIARLLMAAAFLWFGCMKLFVFGPGGTTQYLDSVWHAPVPVVAAWLAIIVEILGGLAIAVGFKTRWAAAVLALWCLFTAFGFHLPAGGLDNMSNFFKNLTMAAGFLYVVAYGAGALSIDGKAA
jgi:putative oxidoreductase